MKERVIVGRYVERDSWVHRLDPRAKTAAMPLYLAAVVMIDSYAEVLMVLAFALILASSTRISIGMYVRAIKPLLFLIMFIFLFHLLVDPGGTRLIDLGLVALYSGGMERGFVSAARMMLFVSFAAMLTFTTPADRLAQGLGSMLGPLRRLGVNPEKAVLMLRVALRFIPTILEEGERLYKAQVSRGLNLKDQALLRKARLVIALLVPITAGVFRRAVVLADAMEARGYRLRAPRTAYRSFAWKAQDTLFLLLFVLPIAATFMSSQ